MTELLQVIFGAFVISGDAMCRSMLIETLRFAVYAYSSLAIMLMSVFRSTMDVYTFNDVLYNLMGSPYVIGPHFSQYPECYILVGWLIIIHGIMSFMSTVSSATKR